MKKRDLATVAMACLMLAACASYQTGSAHHPDELKRLERISGKTSLSVCPESAPLVAKGVKTVVLVDHKPIGTLKANSFVHVELEPGEHGVLLRHDGINSGSGGFMTLQTAADEVRYLWVGVTGNGWGVLTIDDFDNADEAQTCVRGAEYSVLADGDR